MKKILTVLFFLNSFLFSLETCTPSNYSPTGSYILQRGSTYSNQRVDINKLEQCVDIGGNPSAGSGVMLTSCGYDSKNPTTAKICKSTIYNFTYLQQCPAPEQIVFGYECVDKPTCTDSQIYDASTNSCISAPAPDADGDGTPDKCDFDHPDFKISDCDSDGKMNSADPDLDGDGTDDVNDADMNNDGIPDAQQPDSPNYNANCQGADLSRDYVKTGVIYPETNYYLKGNMFVTQCIALVDYDNIDSSFSAYDKNPQCNATYCYVHLFKPDCNDESGRYIPQGSGWIYKAGIQSQTQCSALVDNVKYSQSTFEAPNLTQCPDSKYCYLKRVTNVPDINNSISESIDTNRTSSDLQPLLEAHNVSNQHLTDIKTKIDSTNTKLDDLKGVSNEILNKNESMDASLKGLKSNSDKSLKNDLEALSALSNISNATQKSNDINKAFSDVSTKNQVIGNEHLSSIDGKMNTNNSLLTSIDNSLKGDGTSPDTSALDGAESALTDFDAFVDSVTSQFSTFKDNIQGNLDDVMNQYNNAKSLLTSGQAPTMSGGGSLECASFNVFGKHVVLDLSFLSVLSPVFYYIFTAYFMFLNFSFLIRHLFGSGN